MSQLRIERILTVLCTTSGLLFVINLACTATVWRHWTEILDNCPNYRCGCILYGVSGSNFFMGGRNIFCHFTTSAPIPGIILSALLAVYHGYRSCIVPHKRNQRNKNQRSRRRNGEVAVVSAPNEPAWAGGDPGCTCWGVFVGIACLVTVLLIASAVITTNGYYNTCNQYRRTLVKSLVASGNTAKVVYNRLPCGAIFDFMDYIEPTTRPFRIKDESRYKPFQDENAFYRGNFINTGLALQMSLSCLWINFIIWITVLAYYSKLTRAGGACYTCVQN